MTLTQVEFDQLMQSLTLALSQRNLEQALIEKDRVLAEGTPEMKGQCLQLRSRLERIYPRGCYGCEHILEVIKNVPFGDQHIQSRRPYLLCYHPPFTT